MNFVKNLSVFLCSLFISFNLQAQNFEDYYGEEITKQTELKDQALKTKLNQILRAKHQKVENSPDKIVDSCPAGGQCYSHVSAGYNRAKLFLLSNYNLQETRNGYYVKDVYCEDDYAIPAPNRLPDSNVLNVEHTWPQSKFTRSFATDIQKADLHHLYPSDSQINSTRGNHPFGEVTRVKKTLKCNSSKLGFAKDSGELIFEPPQLHRGNVARALFYFSVRYQLAIDPRQEAFLKEWHQNDPVDADEIHRNNEIFKLQGNRNPFIDMPELAERISDF